VVLLLLAAGCNGGGGGSREIEEAQGYADALVTTIYEDGFELFPEEEARCAAQGWVEVIGVDSLVQAGVAPEEFARNHDLTAGALELTKLQEEEIVGVFYDCVNLSTDHFASCFGSDVEHSNSFRKFITAELLGTDEESEVAARASRLIGVPCLGGA
jgi:hypothetical protein